MRLVLIAAAAALLTACQTTETSQVDVLLAEGRAITAEIEAATDEYGWTVRCTDDQHKAERTCRASKFGSGPIARPDIPFQVYYVNQSGPHILAGHHTFPGRQATVRVDNGAVIEARRATSVVSALQSGSTAYVVYHVWPEGERRMTVDVRGFANAYRRLQEIR